MKPSTKIAISSVASASLLVPLVVTNVIPIVSGKAFTFLGLNTILSSITLTAITAGSLAVLIPTAALIFKKLIPYIKRKREERKLKQQVRYQMLVDAGVIKPVDLNNKPKYGVKEWKQRKHVAKKELRKISKYKLVKINCSLLGGSSNQMALCMISKKPTSNGKFIIFSPYISKTKNKFIEISSKNVFKYGNIEDIENYNDAQSIIDEFSGIEYVKDKTPIISESVQTEKTKNSPLTKKLVRPTPVVQATAKLPLIDPKEDEESKLVKQINDLKKQLKTVQAAKSL